MALLTSVTTKMLHLLFVFALLVPALSHPAFPISLRLDGQTYEPCRQDSECVDPRTCVDIESLAQCSAAKANCICVPPVALQPCSSSEDCEQGELCAAGLPTISYNCVSGRIVASDSELREVDAANDSPRGPNDGLTLDQCRTDLQCRGNRQCSLEDSVMVVSCDENAPSCVCTPPTGFQNCTASAQCPQREVCASGVVDSGNFCIGKVIADESDDYEQVDPPAATNGLTFDSCQSGVDCKSSNIAARICVGPDNKLCEGVSASCVCIPFVGLAFCGDNRDCASGEVCAKGLVRGTQYDSNCMSSSFVNSVSSVEEYDGPGNGGTMLPCRSPGGCESDKTCADANSFASASLKECTITSFPCLCAPKSGLIICESSAVCPDGEVCATNPFADQACVSRSVIDDEEAGTFVEVPGQSPKPGSTDDSGTDPTPSVEFGIEPSPPPVEVSEATPGPVDGDGLTLDTCSGSPAVGDCKDQRICFTVDSDFGLTTELCSEESDECACAFRSLTLCNSSTDCIGMEVCAMGFPLPAERSSCVSTNALSNFDMEEVQDENLDMSPIPTMDDSTTPTPTETGLPDPASSPSPSASEAGVGSSPPGGAGPSPDAMATPGSEENGSAESSPPPSPSPRAPICVDARALAHMRPEELVFDEHNVAEVLCDENESCATPGHMVVFNGKAIMMRTYCELVLCERRVMAVNSPKYQRRLRVESNTEGLLYTAFAARYETRGEELALSTLTRIGL